MLKKAVSVSREDFVDYLCLTDQGVQVTAQMVPPDKALDFIGLIKKETAAQ